MNASKKMGNGIHRGQKDSLNVGQRQASILAQVDPTGVPVDRMVHYEVLNKRIAEITNYMRTGECPACKKRPIGCTHRAGGYMYCKACGHRWEA